MDRGADGQPVLESGRNSTVEYRGERYHVQTEFSMRSAPVVESMVFRGGEVLVRFTASLDDVARRHGFNGDDGRHLAELQHTDLIRKIRHGMLRDDEEAGEQAVRELFQDLRKAIEAARRRERAAQPPAADGPWWRRLALWIRR